MNELKASQIQITKDRHKKRKEMRGVLPGYLQLEYPLKDYSNKVTKINVPPKEILALKSLNDLEGKFFLFMLNNKAGNKEQNTDIFEAKEEIAMIRKKICESLNEVAKFHNLKEQLQYIQNSKGIEDKINIVQKLKRQIKCFASSPLIKLSIFIHSKMVLSGPKNDKDKATIEGVYKAVAQGGNYGNIILKSISKYKTSVAYQVKMLDAIIDFGSDYEYKQKAIKQRINIQEKQIESFTQSQTLQYLETIEKNTPKEYMQAGLVFVSYLLEKKDDLGKTKSVYLKDFIQTRKILEKYNGNAPLDKKIDTQKLYGSEQTKLAQLFCLDPKAAQRLIIMQMKKGQIAIESLLDNINNLNKVLSPGTNNIRDNLNHILQYNSQTFHPEILNRIIEIAVAYKELGKSWLFQSILNKYNDGTTDNLIHDIKTKISKKTKNRESDTGNEKNINISESIKMDALLRDLSRNFLIELQKKLGMDGVVKQEELEKWELPYVSKLAQTYNASTGRERERLDGIIKSAFQGNFYEYITKGSIGKQNKQTQRQLEQNGIDFDTWTSYKKTTTFEAEKNGSEQKNKNNGDNEIQKTRNDIYDEIILLIGQRSKSIKPLLSKKQAIQVFQLCKGFGVQINESGISEQTTDKNIQKSINEIIKILKSKEKTFSKHIDNLSKLSSQLTKEKIETKQFNIRLWDRNPRIELFLGNYTADCSAIDGMADRRGMVPRHLLYQMFNYFLIEDKSSGKIIGKAGPVFIAKNNKEEINIILDNIEVNPNFTEYSNAIGKYLESFAQGFSSAIGKTGSSIPIFIGHKEIRNFNDIPTYMYRRQDFPIQPIGKQDGDKEYLDCVYRNGWHDINKFNNGVFKIFKTHK